MDHQTLITYLQTHPNATTMEIARDMNRPQTTVQNWMVWLLRARVVERTRIAHKQGTPARYRLSWRALSDKTPLEICPNCGATDMVEQYEGIDNTCEIRVNSLWCGWCEMQWPMFEEDVESQEDAHG